jgi:hypothetical protein
VSDFPETPVLRLQLIGKFGAFAKRRVFEVHLSKDPILPSFPWVNHWIDIYFFGLGEEV